jgi:hypothetical protein
MMISKRYSRAALRASRALCVVAAEPVADRRSSPGSAPGQRLRRNGRREYLFKIRLKEATNRPASALRSLFPGPGRFFWGAGGGVVADSVPEREYAETMSKAQGMLKALGLGD